jgi:hypothetical protein
MKHTLLLLSCAFTVSVVAQNTVNLTSAQYTILKANHQLEAGKKYVFTDTNIPAPVKYKGQTKSPSTICSCMVPLDSSFSLVPFIGGVGPDFRNDDSYTNLIHLPFTYSFYGQPVDSLFINNNGNISFTSPYSTFTSNPFPDPSYNMIAPF